MTEQDFETGGTSSKQEEPSALQFPRDHPERYADFRCDLAAGFFAAVSFPGFLPSIGINISFWPAAAFLVFLAGFFGAFVSDLSAADTPRQRLHQVDYVSPLGRAFAARSG